MRRHSTPNFIQFCHETRKLCAEIHVRPYIKYDLLPIFTKLMFAGQQFVRNSYTELHKNPRNRLVSDTGLHR